jgi:hypothetical protein
MKQGPEERAVEQINVLDELLCERDGLLTVMDRIVALHGTARLIRATIGVDSGFVADLDGPDRASPSPSVRASAAGPWRSAGRCG